MTFEFLFPIIDAEFGRRLFDADLIDAIDANIYDLKAMPARIEKDIEENAAYPGYVADLKVRLERYRRWAADAVPFAEMSFREKVEAQLGFVEAMPDFSATPEEMADDNARYIRYVNRVTAEAEIIDLWIRL
jgi:hypothetical protein